MLPVPPLPPSASPAAVPFPPATLCASATLPGGDVIPGTAHGAVGSERLVIGARASGLADLYALAASASSLAVTKRIIFSRSVDNCLRFPALPIHGIGPNDVPLRTCQSNVAKSFMKFRLAFHSIRSSTSSCLKMAS